MTRFAVASALAAGLFTLALAGCSSPAPPGGDCSPGQTRCEENSYQVCNDDGDGWNSLENCASQGTLCIANVGCQMCFPDTRSCIGQEVALCRPDGAGYDIVESCDVEAREECSGGVCRDACELAAMSRDYEGCEYWAIDLDNAVVDNIGAATAQQYSVVVSNASMFEAEVNVEIWCGPADAANPATPCTLNTPYVVEGPIRLGPGDLKVIDLDPREVDGSTRPELNDGTGTFKSSNAYHIVSNTPIIAYQFNPLENVGVFSNDASLLLPTEALSDSYLVASWPQTLAQTQNPNTNAGIHLRAFLTIVGVEDGTTVDIQLSTRILGGGGIRPANAGEVLTLELDRFDVINLETDGFNADFTGTTIRAYDADGVRKVAVFTGSEASDSPRFDSLATRSCCADHLEEQVFPEDSFGNQFVAVHTPSRSKMVDAAGWDVAVVEREPEFWRILASRANTIVTTNLPAPLNSFTLGRGEDKFLESNRDFLVSSSGPIALLQVPASQQATGIPSTLPGGERPPGGDPSLIWIPPIEQWRSRYLFLVPNKYAFDTLLIAAPSTAHLLYDGLPIDMVATCDHETIGTQTPPGGGAPIEYVAIRCQLSFPVPGGGGAQDDGVHLLTETDHLPFGLVVWGWDSFVSYGYPGGSNVERINVQ